MDTDRSPGTPEARALRHGRIAAVVVSALVLAGCAVRVETPPPPPPVPGPLEVVRQDAALASASLAEDAGRASLETLDERRFAVLERVRLEAESHVEALGGVYSVEEGEVVEPSTGTGTDGAAEDEEGADEEVADEESSPAEPALEPVDPADLVVALVTEAGSARSAADRVADGGLARLLVAVATSRLVAADTLARNLDVDRPGLGNDLAPTALPDGPSAADLAAVVVAEDQAGFAFEMIAARSSERLRDRARAAAKRHRATSDAWARLAGITDPGLDPRSVSYALDGALESPESREDLAARVESALLTSYSSLVALAEPGSRAELAELHTLAADSVRRWGGAPGALPGLPEPSSSD